MNIAPRFAAPLAACAIAVGSIVVGGACLIPTSDNPPKLQTGVYVLTPGAGQSQPLVYADPTGRTFRVIADTFSLNATTQIYDEHAAVAITPRGGTEQPVTPIIITHQSYTLPAPGNLNFITTVYGASIVGYTLSTTSFQLSLPGGYLWNYNKR